MQSSLPDRIMHLLDPRSGEPLTLAIYGAIIAVIVLFVVWKVFSGRRRPARPATPDLTIDLQALGNEGPPQGPPVLEFFNAPVRLAVVVLAPAGRIRELPPMNRWDTVFDAIIPGLDKIVALHDPLLRRWPAQLSPSGFAHMFFKHAQLPGDGGKGTPWCSVAGIFKIEGQALMAGLVLRTESPSSLGQQIIDAQQKWLGCLRVKEGRG